QVEIRGRKNSNGPAHVESAQRNGAPLPTFVQQQGRDQIAANRKKQCHAQSAEMSSEVAGRTHRMVRSAVQQKAVGQHDGGNRDGAPAVERWNSISRYHSNLW